MFHSFLNYQNNLGEYCSNYLYKICTKEKYSNNFSSVNIFERNSTLIGSNSRANIPFNKNKFLKQQTNEKLNYFSFIIHNHSLLFISFHIQIAFFYYRIFIFAVKYLTNWQIVVFIITKKEKKILSILCVDDWKSPNWHFTEKFLRILLLLLCET